MSTSGTLIATICARGGSKGLPRKNVLPFAGLPLIAHSIRQALACPQIQGVYVSTDDEEIAQVARTQHGQTLHQGGLRRIAPGQQQRPGPGIAGRQG